MISTFDTLLERHDKESGMMAAAMAKGELLEVARSCALHFASQNYSGTCTSDDVAGEMQRRGYDYTELGNAAGSIFKGKQWAFTGSYTASKRPAAHKRDIKIWRLI